MRIQFLAFLAAVLLSVAHASAKPSYYVALGDSLAIGLQPSPAGDLPTAQGYADDIFAVFHLLKPGLTLVKLGCSGETTYTMIYGGKCSYAEGSQLAAALNFLETHDVALVTLDIGANDVDGCVTLSPLNINTTCVEKGVANVNNYLPQVLSALRSAAGKGTLIVGMNYYDPFLAAWTLGPSGQVLANQSLEAAVGFTFDLEGVYSLFDVPVADVAKTFHISDTTNVPVIKLPLDVFLTLTWTWMAAPAPLGPDIHPNAAGYSAIAGAFIATIVKL
jgi:lysophospholipase L1-like esterase